MMTYLLLCLLLHHPGLAVPSELQPPPWTLTQFATPAGPGSGQAFMVGDEKTLHLTWYETSSGSAPKLCFAFYQEGQWRPTQVIRQAATLLVNWADTPKLAVAGDMLMVTWPELPTPDSTHSSVNYALSKDQGQTWTAPQCLHDDQTGIEYGFVSLAAIGPDRIAAIWLDSRNLGPFKTDHSEDPEGAMQLRGREIGWNHKGPEQLIDPSTCECCATDLVVAKGRWTAAYRAKSATSIRDISVASASKGHWLPARNLVPDNWNVMGCPVNGPALDQWGKSLALVWYSGAKGTTVALTVSADAGKSFGPRLVLSQQNLGMVDCAFVRKNRLAVSWVSQQEQGPQVELALFDLHKKQVRKLDQARIAPYKTGLPRLTRLGPDLVLAYQDAVSNQLQLLKLETIAE